MTGFARFIRLLPVLLIVAGAAYAFTTPRQFTAVPLLAAAPLAAAPFFSFTGTLLTALTATAVVTAEHLQGGTLAKPQAYTEQITLVMVSALALVINVVIRRGGVKLASARENAEAAQRAVLPTPAQRFDGLRVAARYEAAAADALIGGDFFAVQTTPYGVRAVVGDVRGKGLEAVGAVAVAVGAFREAVEREADLATVAGWLDGALTRERERRGGQEADELFATAVLAEFPAAGGVVRLVNRGHPAPLLIDPGRTPRLLEPEQAALPLGMAGLGSAQVRPQEYPFGPQATLLLYTDGLTEARNAHGTFYEPLTALADTLFSHPAELLEMVVADVMRHTGGSVTDDTALIALTADPGE
ncbi:PP2C family protein-serine/threonine phosphatase [Streptomyces albipurpureus]|uniref:Serine/threonine-protein phosphatase n=1 Tax=Streptomyces albipurpureus TaxID=2897419 RepID=A0ABT0UME9_9ACTN|nr:PP2C family protein-serine/threonine phosphatase [Streptomyces sp. CWNU-1]MCM2389625.1 serine/threonine-protein phosphatase [Streptomyces sp. CWNU-1]